jgi:4-amino-4-deoxy-L-arabinose transferase-like glycosyltransferase
VSVFCFFLCLLITSILISEHFYDLSWDGQYYQQEGVIQLAKGWNPLVQEISLRHQTVFVNHYPKASWIAGAILYQMRGSIEAGKAFNLMFGAGSFLLCLSALLRCKFDAKSTALLSFLICLNPVSIYQSLSFCIDGQISSLLTSVCAVFAIIFRRRENRIEFLILLFLICVIVNTKLTGIFYSIVLGGGLIVLAWLDRQVQKALQIGKVGILSLFLGISLFGYHPYITNTLHYGHPFYPLGGSGKVDIMTKNMPLDFQDDNRFEKLFRSLFSKSANIGSSYTKETSRLKIPFIFYGSQELSAFRDENTRVGGFGVLFGSAIIVSLITGLTALRIDLKKTLLAFLIAGIILVSALINPEAWWARYVPQLWLIPMIFIILTLQIREKCATVNFWRSSIICLLALNIYLVSCVYLHHNFSTTRQIQYQLTSFAKNNVTLLIDFSYFWSDRIRLQEQGVKFIEVKTQDLSCQQPVSLIGAQETRFCLKE